VSSGLFQSIIESSSLLNGDREIDMVLTAIERAQARNPRPNTRHRIEHASIMTPAMLERAKEQPSF
jgi:predicted amidohydrolase YtcJ